MDIFWKRSHPQVIQNVDELYFFPYITAVNGCRQNESQNSW